MLILIPAKKNSKRLKFKNRKTLGHQPLISWTIKFAKKITNTENIVVSTNCKHIAKIAKNENCEIPFLRPNSLSKNNTSMYDVAHHAIKEIEKIKKKDVKSILLLQPTSPFRDVKLIKKAIIKFNKNLKTIISASELHVKSDKLFTKRNNTLFRMNKSSKSKITLIPNGSFYLITKKNLFKYKDFYHDKMQFVLINNFKEKIDIDYNKDFELAKKFISF
tara:strand:- start:5620 stop:6276 length:657 start_codon:yes stop_codon:yes gene_type:complete